MNETGMSSGTSSATKWNENMNTQQSTQRDLLWKSLWKSLGIWNPRFQDSMIVVDMDKIKGQWPIIVQFM